MTIITYIEEHSAQEIRNMFHFSEVAQDELIDSEIAEISSAVIEKLNLEGDVSEWEYSDLIWKNSYICIHDAPTEDEDENYVYGQERLKISFHDFVHLFDEEREALMAEGDEETPAYINFKNKIEEILSSEASKKIVIKFEIEGDTIPESDKNKGYA